MIRVEISRTINNLSGGATVISVTRADTNDDAIAAAIAAGTAPPSRTITNSVTTSALISAPGAVGGAEGSGVMPQAAEVPIGAALVNAP